MYKLCTEKTCGNRVDEGGALARPVAGIETETLREHFQSGINRIVRRDQVGIGSENCSKLGN